GALCVKRSMLPSAVNTPGLMCARLASRCAWVLLCRLTRKTILVVVDGRVRTRAPAAVSMGCTPELGVQPLVAVCAIVAALMFHCQNDVVPCAANVQLLFVEDAGAGTRLGVPDIEVDILETSRLGMAIRPEFSSESEVDSERRIHHHSLDNLGSDGDDRP